MDGQVVRGWKAIGLGETAMSDQVDFLEFELVGPAQHRLQPSAGSLVLEVRSETFNLPFPTLPATGEEEADLGALRVDPYQGETISDSGSPIDPWSLERSIGFGMTRHRPIRIAQEEVEVSQAKVREARRALYPAATAKFSWTSGTASNVDFREYTTGLQVEQPLFHSGRLIDSYRQALVNLQAAEKRQNKVRSDFAMDLAQEYYQYVAAKMARVLQENLVREAEEFYQKSQIRFNEGLLTRLELLNVESQMNQARFQRATSENDEVLARLKFVQKLGMDAHTAVVEVPLKFETPSARPIDIEEALALANRYRPDVLVNALVVQFHEYEERIAKAKGKWKIDLSGFAGTSASAFETEPLDAGEDYFIGLKASRNWGANSTNASVTKTKTSPRLGQTTRTESTVYSTEMGILDQLGNLTEIQQARVNLEKARRDLEESKSTIYQEIQEAYLSYKKSLLQLDYAKQKVAFREEQVRILQAQASLNEALPSQVLEAVMRLTDERAGTAQAISSYYVALAKLNKAIGLAGYYK